MKSLVVRILHTFASPVAAFAHHYSQDFSDFIFHSSFNLSALISSLIDVDGRVGFVVTVRRTRGSAFRILVAVLFVIHSNPPTHRR